MNDLSSPEVEIGKEKHTPTSMLILGIEGHLKFVNIETI